eukprot:scaffold26710_cov113-Skeletonema_menzelii.AAC.1
MVSIGSDGPMGWGMTKEVEGSCLVDRMEAEPLRYANDTTETLHLACFKCPPVAIMIAPQQLIAACIC